MHTHTQINLIINRKISNKFCKTKTFGLSVKQNRKAAIANYKHVNDLCFEHETKIIWNFPTIQ